MKHYFSIFLLLIMNALYSQTSTAIQYYDLAVGYFNQQNYKVAYSIFTLSNDLEPHKDTYYSRAVCRLRMGNKNWVNHPSILEIRKIYTHSVI